MKELRAPIAALLVLVILMFTASLTSCMSPERYKEIADKVTTVQEKVTKVNDAITERRMQLHQEIAKQQTLFCTLTTGAERQAAADYFNSRGIDYGDPKFCDWPAADLAAKLSERW